MEGGEEEREITRGRRERQEEGMAGEDRGEYTCNLTLTTKTG